jgi:hypothetical protein
MPLKTHVFFALLSDKVLAITSNVLPQTVLAYQKVYKQLLPGFLE